MSRLTKYASNNQSMFPYQLKNDELYTKLDSIHKLGKLEDIEDKLGCSLELYFNLKSGTEILDKSNNLWFLESITNHKALNCYREEEVYNYIGIGKFTTIYHNFKIKNYKKTWWLKEDKSE